MSSIFSRIIAGQIPCYKIAEDDSHLAFLDINPLTKGHLLVIPKKEVDYLFDLTDQEYTALWSFASVIAQGMKRALKCTRVGVAVIGMEVPHTHIHLIPIEKEGDMNFSNPKLSLSKEEMEKIAQQIRAVL